MPGTPKDGMAIHMASHDRLRPGRRAASEGEPLLQGDRERCVLFPVEDDEIWAMYKQ